MSTVLRNQYNCLNNLFLCSFRQKLSLSMIEMSTIKINNEVFILIWSSNQCAIFALIGHLSKQKLVFESSTIFHSCTIYNRKICFTFATKCYLHIIFQMHILRVHLNSQSLNRNRKRNIIWIAIKSVFTRPLFCASLMCKEH